MQNNQKPNIVKFLWPHIAKYKWYYLLIAQAPFLSAFYPLFYNLAVKLFIDTVISEFTYADVILPIFLFIVANLIIDITWRINQWADYRSVPYVKKSILLTSYDYVQNHSYEFFQNTLSGSISSKLKGIIDGFEDLSIKTEQGFFRIWKTIIGIIGLFFINYYIGIFMLCWCLIYFNIMYRLSEILNKLSFTASESRHQLIGQISDKISNIISVITFAAKKREFDNLKKNIDSDYIPKQSKLLKFDFYLQIIAALLFFIMYIALLFLVVELRRRDIITVGDFAFVFGVILMLQEDIWHSVQNLQAFAKSVGDFRNSLDIITIPQQNLDKKSAKKLKINAAKIEFKNVNFAYANNNEVIKSFNLTIQAGEKIGIVGLSGSGKSTLINLFLKYFLSDSGHILISDQNLADLKTDSIRENIAVIPQDTYLFHRSIAENIAYGKAKASKAEIIAASKKAHIHDFIIGLEHGYDTLVGEKGIKLSGGQRQRIAIARAILKDAAILVLDEATSALDSKTEIDIQKSLNFLIKNKQKTVIAIAHRLSTLKHMDRIILLDKGKIVEEGKHDQLISKEQSLYRKLWDMQKI